MISIGPSFWRGTDDQADNPDEIDRERLADVETEARAGQLYAWGLAHSFMLFPDAIDFDHAEAIREDAARLFQAILDREQRSQVEPWLLRHRAAGTPFGRRVRTNFGDALGIAISEAIEADHAEADREKGRRFAEGGPRCACIDRDNSEGHHVACPRRAYIVSCGYNRLFADRLVEVWAEQDAEIERAHVEAAVENVMRLAAAWPGCDCDATGAVHHGACRRRQATLGPVFSHQVDWDHEDALKEHARRAPRTIVEVFAGFGFSTIVLGDSVAVMVPQHTLDAALVEIADDAGLPVGTVRAIYHECMEAGQ